MPDPVITPIIILLIAVLIMAIRFVYMRRQVVVARMLLEAADATLTGFVIFSHTGIFEYANKRAMGMIPILNRNNPIKHNFKSFLDYLYDHAQTFDESVEHALIKVDPGAENFSFREFVSFNDGRYYLVNMRKVKNERVVFLLNDVSESKLREENIRRLHKHNHQLLQAIEASTCGIVVSDPKQHENPIIFVNDTLSAFMGVEPAEFLKEGWPVLIALLQEGSVQSALHAAIATGENVEFDFRREVDQGELWFALKFNVVINEEGTPDYHVCVLTDITLLKQRENELFQAQKLEALGQLAAGMAHDFNNILSVVEGYTLMARKIIHTDPDKAVDYADKISASAKRGAGLTQKMLTFSRHKVISKNIVNLPVVLEESRAFLEPFLDSGVRFELILPKEDIHIMATADAIGQVLVNLCINSRDAMLQGGLMQIKLSQLPVSKISREAQRNFNCRNVARISVTDSGIGMNNKTLERIFDPFFTTKAQGKGTGLGLSVVYGLVREMGGVIEVNSAPGRGTEMIVYLPATDQKPLESIIAEHKNKGALSLKGHTIMLVEDEPDLLYAVANILESYGLSVIAASCGDEALFLQDHHDGEIDVLLTDVIMPGMNGVKLAELFCALRPESRVMFMSGYPASGDMAPVELPGDALFIAKPVDYNNMVKVLCEVIAGENISKIRNGHGGDIQMWV